MNLKVNVSKPYVQSTSNANANVNVNETLIATYSKYSKVELMSVKQEVGVTVVESVDNSLV